MFGLKLDSPFYDAVNGSNRPCTQRFDALQTAAKGNQMPLKLNVKLMCLLVSSRYSSCVCRDPQPDSARATSSTAHSASRGSPFPTRKGVF